MHAFRFRRATGFIVMLLAAAIVAACGGGSGSTPATGTGATSTGPVQTLALGANGISGSLLGTSAAGVFLAEAPSQPAEDFSTNPAITTYPITVSETAGVTGLSLNRVVASADGVPLKSIARDPETLFEIPQSAFTHMREFISTAHGTPVDARITQSLRKPKANVGDSRVFHILASSIGNSGQTCQTAHPGFTCFVDITATLTAQSTHGNVWVDNASLQTPGEFTSNSDFTTVASLFDTFYAGETALYGASTLPTNVDFTPQCDANGVKLTTPDTIVDDTGTSGDNAGGRIDIVVTDLLTALGEGGFFFAGNFFPQAALNCQAPPRQISNEVPMIVVTGNNYPTGPSLPQFNENYWLTTDMPRTLSHELQHLLHFTNKVLRPAVTGGVPTQDDPFIDEGNSMLAEDLFANGIAIDTPRFTYSFLLEPNLFALTSFTGFQPNPTSTAANPPYGYFTNTAGSYGEAYLFMRYIYDRFGGNAAIQRLYASHASGAGPALAAANNEPFEQLYGEFCLAIAAQANGAAIGGDPRYSFGPELTLRGPVNVTSRRSAPLQVRHLVFGGPQTPETFSASNVVNGIFTLTPGASTTINLIAGGTLYFPLAAVTNGATVHASAPLPILQGGLVQGQIPTPQPTSL
jgi:hypothetical protein